MTDAIEQARVEAQRTLTTVAAAVLRAVSGDVPALDSMRPDSFLSAIEAEQSYRALSGVPLTRDELADAISYRAEPGDRDGMCYKHAPTQKPTERQ